jgi:hypothetical protein
MSDLPKNSPATLRDSLSSLLVVLIVTTLSIAVVFTFGLVFRP